ncbi:hypothetical protein BDV97DRAFT_366489 [Delphinella strobiligena]|nr:hypothetical protein BDV97DRAFT_366489 [Delphinella strobiligena]
MRDRRNTNLSISSTSSTSSTKSPVFEVSLDSTEKGRFLWAPLATPGAPLPSPILKHARESQQSLVERLQSRLSWKRLLLIVTLTSVVLCYHFTAQFDYNSRAETPSLLLDNKYYFHAGAEVPQDPTPLIFEDNQAKTRWTISIPQSQSFPLRPHQYKSMCQASERVSKSVEFMGGRSRIMGKHHHNTKPYYSVDTAFMDVDEAESMAFLPNVYDQRSISVVGRGQENITNAANICDKSLTFVLESDNAGFGSSLLSLWMAYGLAKKEGRHFFIDDSNWPYGSYASYFPEPPKSSCSPPPAHHIVPCPHSARHLVASAATMPWIFGSTFKDEFTRPRRSGVNKNREIFDLIRIGYEDLFSLIGEDASFLEEQVAVLKATSSNTGAPIIGMHIRRGDRHPYELEFSNDYLPYDHYTAAAADMLARLAPNFTASDENLVTLLLSSDDPDVYTSLDLANTLPPNVVISRAQERIVLASKSTLPAAVPVRNGAYTKHVDENSGWEGGFYSSLFFGLGGGHVSTTDPTDEEKEIMQQAMSLRTLVGRGYLLDLAVLSKADAVVCASSSAACRVLAVMMGWDKVVKGEWKNVDAARYWSWDGQL